MEPTWGLLISVAGVAGVLVIDKVVAMTKCKWDDLIWTSIKTAFKKARGKK